MSDWSSGYNVEAGYTFGYYRELSPAWLDYAATIEGYATPPGQWRYLELGCGYGFGLILLASIYPEHEFVGVDFNPQHIAHARRLASSAGLTNVTFEEADFLDLARDWPDTWGQFDYIVAHGIISWLSSTVRKAIFQAIGNASAPGALVYLSYNALPGKLTNHTIQHLLRMWQTSEAIPASLGVTEGLKRLEGLIGANAAMGTALPVLKSQLENIKKQNPNYLIHEYLHDEWHPQWFNEVVAEVSAAKLSFVGSANISDLFIKSIMPADRKQILDQYDDPIVKEVMIDVLINQGFRKDIFVRGREKLPSIKQADMLLNMQVMALEIPGQDKDITIQTSLGELTGKAEVYRPILDALSQGHQTIASLLKTQAEGEQKLANVLQAVSLMVHAGYVGLYTPAVDDRPAKFLNKAIAASVAEGGAYRNLVCSQSSQVISASETDLIMLHEVLTDPALQDASVLWQRMYQRLQRLGKSLAKDGEVLTDVQAVQTFAANMADTFLTKTLPAWKTSGVC